MSFPMYPIPISLESSKSKLNQDYLHPTTSTYIIQTNNQALPLDATIDQVESNNFINSERLFKNTNVRHAFIRKVFGLVATQIILTLAIMCLIKFVPTVTLFLLRNSWIIWIIMGCTFILMVVLGCIEWLARSYPLNLILLFAFTIMESVLVGFISLSYNTNTLFISACITLAIVFALILFSLQTKYDFTDKGVYLLVLGLCLMSFGFICIIFLSHFMLLLYSVLGAAFFSMYLIFDVQLMLADKHKYSISPEDYVMASLNLYVDIINLFLMILNLVRASED